ncbi:MAG: mannose-1-phosphate guanyltransferase, partial [Campylobacterales bacterium]|nr:mannose-1-phosphate guanyltransferase [Campylobacterales bacterium]
DLLYGSTSTVYPDIINQLDIENIVLNAYIDDKKLSKISTIYKKSQENVGKIVKSLDYDIGFVIYPNGQRLEIVAKDGDVLTGELALLSILSLLNMCDKQSKVYLSVWTPDIMDNKFTNLEIHRGKFNNFKASQLKSFDFIGSTKGDYAFSEFSISKDAIYTSLKIVEMLAINHVNMDSVLKSIDNFYYNQIEVPCPSALKGKMMRKFLENSKGKEASHLDGVKIWIDEKDWILMIPDQHDDSLHLYIQAVNDSKGKEILEDYLEKIEEWRKED